MKNLSASVLLFLTCITFGHPGLSQDIDLLIKGGHVIDARNKIDAKMDVAITDAKLL